MTSLSSTSSPSLHSLSPADVCPSQRVGGGASGGRHTGQPLGTGCFTDFYVVSEVFTILIFTFFTRFYCTSVEMNRDKLKVTTTEGIEQKFRELKSLVNRVKSWSTKGTEGTLHPPLCRLEKSGMYSSVSWTKKNGYLWTVCSLDTYVLCMCLGCDTVDFLSLVNGYRLV